MVQGSESLSQSLFRSEGAWERFVADNGRRLERHAAMSRHSDESVPGHQIPLALRIIKAQSERLLDYQQNGAEDRPVDAHSFLITRRLPFRNDPLDFALSKTDKWHDLSIGSRCALCKYSDPLIFFNFRTASGPQLRIQSNLFRYGRTSLLIMPSEHVHQSSMPEYLSAVLDFQQHAGPKYSFFFNGLRGNSQSHAHFQALEEKLPLRRALEEKAIPTMKLSGSQMGKVTALVFDGRLTGSEVGGSKEASAHQADSFYGLHLAGPHASVGRCAATICEAYESDFGAGHYNLMSWMDRTGQCHVIFIPRSNQNAHPEGGCYGALGHSGLLIYYQAFSNPLDAKDVSHRLWQERQDVSPVQWQAYLHRARISVAINAKKWAPTDCFLKI